MDAAGRIVTSGLWDEHVHFGQWAQQASRLDCGDLTDPDAVLERVRSACVDGATEVIAVRVRGSAWGRSLTRERLDAAGGAVPVVLIGIDLHGAWLNTAALRRYGHDPAGSSHVVEDDCFALVRELDRISDAELDVRVADAAAAAAARGVVGIVDFEMRWGIEDWVRRERSGFDTLRVETAVYPQHLDRAIAEGLRTGDALGTGGRLRVGPLKIITDGSLGTHTAWCCDPYPDGDHGRSLVGPDDLIALLGRARDAGFSAAVHAIGDRAGAAALDAFDAVGVGGRIEHAQLLRTADLARFARLGVEASVQPEHLLDDREAVARLWPGRAERTFPFASLLRSGARLRFGSDAPVAPLDPWRGIAAAVHRSLPGEAAWVPAERIGVEEALRSSMRGSVRPAVGAPADLILLDQDPLRVEPAALTAVEVAATLVGGHLTHVAPGVR
ncbi:amidohydrolase [Leucobacter rhizosphaerae]|uniref:amidohydrolase n=1 Tax=Leucobacter rhizosphaerae TaxID=2932245 RepID=UPI0024B53EA7|nr:amidohydrolase family protein [Leucobacter rhizosphaerae]